MSMATCCLCAAIFRLIKVGRISAYIGRHRIERTLEVGCAYGISSLYICDAISKQPNPHHIMIDPLQSTRWSSVGVQNLRRAGFTFWELIEQPSALALPSLLGSGLKVQFALIDGWHTFDQVLLDFFYVDRLLEDGGIVAFDDVVMTAINRVVRYVLNHIPYRRDRKRFGSATVLSKALSI
jgi:predicted O-methyltransferase YrrM